MNKYSLLLVGVLAVAACHNSSENHAAVKTDTTAVADSAEVAKAGLKNLHFDYDKDPSCGMPLSAGLSDTSSYKGKLYGFCSRECKDAFLKDPAGYTAKLK